VVKVKDLLAAIEGSARRSTFPRRSSAISSTWSGVRARGDVYLGASPRGSLALFRAGQARAALQGRDHVLPDDIKALAVAVLGHRVIVSPAARLRELSADRIVQEILHSTPCRAGITSFKLRRKRRRARRSDARRIFVC
jgi:MoxR-like ATPase